MRVIVVGCSQAGSALAYQLYKKGHSVTVIDQDASAFDKLPADFQGRLIEGDALTQNVLQRAQIERADSLAAVTSSNSLNILLAYLAKIEYHIPRVLAGNFDPRQRPMQEVFGLPVASSVDCGAQRIEGLLWDAPLRPIYSEDDTAVSIYQLKVPAQWQGRTLRELLPETPDAAFALSRASQPVPVTSTLLLQPGDLIYLNMSPELAAELQLRLDSQEAQA